jgi:PKD repeat protein
MITITSIYAGTPLAMAESNGPYLVTVGSAVTFTGGPSAADTTYAWDFGDGTTAAGQTSTHTYADVGEYVAKLSTTVTAPGGVLTREFARVTVLDVPPVVAMPASVTVNEGQVLQLTATFTHPAWPEHHVALIEWGDDSPIEPGQVNETDAPPEATGTVTANHAYCHASTYTLIVAVNDEHGCTGRAQMQVTVLDAPPHVDAGPDLFAYPCTPLDLVARFTFPGWCETHTASWDFGDCTSPQPATVRERHQPPIGTGVAIATHTYDTCGTFFARCVVVDDSGGVGRAHLLVQVTDINNGDFEHGFHARAAGAVANGWSEYISPNVDVRGQVLLGGETGPGTGPTAFSGDQIILRRGRRSQSISGDNPFQGGIWQHLGTNAGWEYQVTAWYCADDRGSSCRLGLDPAGGTDPDVPTVTWSVGDTAGTWAELCNRVVASGRNLTIFLEAASVSPARMWFDDVRLETWPSRSPEPSVPRPPKPRQGCADWAAQAKPESLGPSFQQNGFTFTNPSGRNPQIVTIGPPAGEGKLLLPLSELHVTFPFAADRVVATVASVGEGLVQLNAAGPGGTATSQSATGGNPVQIQVQGSALSSATLVTRGKEVLLVKLCVYSSQGGETSE